MLRAVQGWVSARVAYPIAERYEKRDVRTKLAELRAHYRQPFAERRRIAQLRLAELVAFAREHVPYYRDLFAAVRFDPHKLARDSRYLEDIPFLTKEVIREQGERLLSRPLTGIRFHAMKTGGSTGPSAMIYYDQTAADYASAVVLFARERVGKKKHMFEVHFASQPPTPPTPAERRRESLKCFAMNRFNVFFDRLDDEGLERIWRQLQRFGAPLVHAHPSTMYALACHVRRQYGTGKAFELFESSGELLEPYQRREIEATLKCRVVDRYGLAEMGVVAYQVVPLAEGLLVFDSEAWPETRPSEEDARKRELVFTGLRNRLMPLIRYRTGDLGVLSERTEGFFLTELTGRIHDLIPINGVPHATHHVQDVLGRIGGIQEFQIDLRFDPPLLRIVPERDADTAHISAGIHATWPQGFNVRFVSHDDLVRVGWRGKFRHVVAA